MLLSCVKKYIRIRHLGCLLAHDTESNTKAKERGQHLKIQQTATPEVSSLCPQDDTGLTLPPSVSRVRAMVGSGYPDAQVLLGCEDLLSALSFIFSISSCISLLVSPIPKTPPLPWSQSSCQESFRLSGKGIYVFFSFVPFPT